jgi:guanyl-specific ribonuclease Sa
MKRILSLLTALLLLVSLFGCTVPVDPVRSPEPQSEIDAPVFTLDPSEPPASEPTDTPCPVSEDGAYWTKDDVALYIHLFGHLPKNYITKSKAQDLGWTGGSLEPYAPGYSIGGDYFGNYEKLLPTKKGRKYTECDIDTRGKKSRGDKRIVFSNDGLIYYTDDHYNSFTLLYGEE